MATLLGLFFLGVSYLATHMGLVPGEETIISQVARAVYGTSIFYYIFQIATMGILVIAANTAFADFPRLASVLAHDNFMPHQFSFRGDRLAFTIGIVALASIAALLVIVFTGNFDSLIHLYAVGVLLASSMSNSGMVVHWWKTREQNWQTSIIIKGAGAILSIITLIIVAITKFALGAWIVIVLIPIIVAFFLTIHRHYSHVRRSRQFVQAHKRLAEPGYFLGANRVLLSPRGTQRVLEGRLPIHDWRWAEWGGAWARREVNRLLPLFELPDGPFRRWEPGRWKGIKTCNVSLWRSDLIRVNGLDESYEGWGLEDTDLVIRLLRSGVKHKTARYAAPVFHLWHQEHSRSGLDENRRRLECLLSSHDTRAAVGLDRYMVNT